ncbi:hypothetical protein [Prescottella sp. R16]|uniref:hypothetical protein n=1 Tax=Prescottella sp. R16 TaxID=3064529 RepID=UPI00272E7777|nr:hypothetical protein [Prescottella sp. R16]
MTVSAAARTAPVAAGLVGGAVAVFAIRETTVQDHISVEGTFRQLVVTPQWAGALAALTAALVLVVLSLRRERFAAPLAAVAGAVLLALPAWVEVTAPPAISLTAVGAGLLLGAAAYAGAGVPAAQAALVFGVVGANLFYAGALWRSREDRWALSIKALPVQAAIPVAVAAIAAVVVGYAAGTARSGTAADRRALAVAAGLPIVATFVYAGLGSISASVSPSPTSWTVAVIVTAGLVVAAARWTGASGGRFLAAGFAVAAVGVNILAYFPGSGWLVAAGVALFAAGAATGRRRPMPDLGIGLLAVAVVTGLWAPATLAAAGYTLVVPFAVGLVVAATLPADPATALTGALLPLTVTLFSVSAPVEWDFGWISYVPGEVDYPLALVGSPLPVGVVVAAAAIVIAWFSIRAATSRR